MCTVNNLRAVRWNKMQILHAVQTKEYKEGKHMACGEDPLIESDQF